MVHMLSTGPANVQWTVVVTGKQIDILKYACAHTDTDAHPQNVYSHKSTHTLKHRYTEATVYTQVYSHSRTSLLAEMEVLSVGWEARIRCIGFWHRILTDQHYHQCLIQRLAYAALMTPRRSQWIGTLGICLESFGWQDCSCATLAGVSGRQLREMLRSIACRCMEKDWTEDLESKPKLCV